MLSLVAKQEATSLTVYMDVDAVNVKQSSFSLDSYLGPDKITLTRRPNNIYVHDDTKIYVEPFVYVDGGIYDSEGTLVDAGYYDTALWAITYNGGYA